MCVLAYEKYLDIEPVPQSLSVPRTCIGLCVSTKQHVVLRLSHSSFDLVLHTNGLGVTSTHLANDDFIILRTLDVSRSSGCESVGRRVCQWASVAGLRSEADR